MLTKYDKILEVFRNREKDIIRILLRGDELGTLEQQIAALFNAGDLQINICNENHMLYFCEGDSLRVYWSGGAANGFMDELMVDYKFADKFILGQGELYTFRMTENLKRRLHIPQVMLVNLHLTERYPSFRFALGVADIAGYLRKYNVAKVKLMDMQFCGIDEVRESIRSVHYDFIGLSANFGHFSLMQELIDYIGYYAADARILLGNYLAATEYKHILDKYPQTLVCSNEGELTIAGLCRNWIYGSKSIKNVPNLYYAEDGESRFTYIQFINLDDLPLPAIDMVEPLFEKHGAMTLEFSRGCNYGKCSFCPRKFKGHYWRGMSAEKMIDMWVFYHNIFQMYQQKAYIYFADEEFLGNCRIEENYNRLVTFLEYVKDNRLEMNFDISCRLDQIAVSDNMQEWTGNQIRLFELAGQCGLKRIFLGLESGSPGQLKRYNKGIDLEQATVSMEILSRMGFVLRLGFITFDPLMSKEELRENIRFISRDDIISDKYLFESISYLASPLEVLRECRYAELIREKYPYLIGEENISDNFGRLPCEYLDQEIKLIYEICQRWINYNFPLIYALKGMVKQHTKQSGRFGKVVLEYRKYTYLLLLCISHCYSVLDLEELTVYLKAIDENLFAQYSESIGGDVKAAVELICSAFQQVVSGLADDLGDMGDEQARRFIVIYEEWRRRAVMEESIIRDN